MSDDTKISTAKTDPAPAAPKVQAPIVNVRGGTHSSWLDKQIAMHHADTKQRWAEQDADIRAVKEAGARRYTHDLGQPNTHPVAVLLYILEGGQKEQYIQCDIVIAQGEDGKPTRTLVLICPRCVGRGIPQHSAQIHINDANRVWHLDEKMRGQVWINPDTNEPVILAGKPDCSERCRCPMVGCDFKFRISGTAPTGHDGVALLVREF